MCSIFTNMKVLPIFIIVLFCINCAHAQADKIYTIKAGEIIPPTLLYALPGFTQGTALLRDGTSTNQPLNFNYLTGEMQFINRAGDTLAIADPGLLQSIIIDTIVFYYDKDYLQQVFKVGSYKIAIRQQLTQLPGKVVGGYGTGNEQGGVQEYGAFKSGFGEQRLRAGKDMAFKKVSTYFIGNEFNRFLKADKKAFLGFFFQKKALIQQYLKDNNIDFTKEEDLKKLLLFCVE